MALIKLSPAMRKELNKRVDYLKRYGDEKNRSLSEAMIAHKMHIAPTTLARALRTNGNFTVEIYNRIVEWLEQW